MALFQCFSLGCRLVGERVRSAQGSSEGLSNELYERVQRSRVSVRATQQQSRSSFGSEPARTSQHREGKGRGNRPRRTLERRRRFFVIARVWFYAQRAAWASSQNQRANWLLPLKRAGVGRRQVADAAAKREQRLSPAKHRFGS